HLKRAIELEPGSKGSYSRLGDVYTQLGRYDEALQAYQQGENPDSSPSTTSRSGQLYARMGKRTEALATISGASSHMLRAAAVHAMLGDKDEALKILEDLIAKRESLLAFFKEDP